MRALRAGIDRRAVYVTNIVKHFRFTPRGKKRIHRRPDLVHVEACRPWLDGELEAIRPNVLVCSGATAAQALLGKDFRVTKQRGLLIESPLAPHVMATRSSDLWADPRDREAEIQASEWTTTICRGDVAQR